MITSGDPDTIHVMNRDVNFLVRAKIGYCCGKHDKKYVTKIQDSIAPHSLIKTINLLLS